MVLTHCKAVAKNWSTERKARLKLYRFAKSTDRDAFSRFITYKSDTLL